MKIKKLNINKQRIFLCIAFVIFFFSFSLNCWHISSSDFYTFERSPEGLVVGKMARSAHDGIFAYGGMTGCNWITLPSGNLAEENETSLAAQHDFYLTGKSLPKIYKPYLSQSGGQAIFYSFIQKILPGSNYFKLKVIRGLNAALTALCFVLFLGWVYRNNGFVCSSATAILLLLSPWINNFAHNLWWSLWNFYIPFLSALLLLESWHLNPKKISTLKFMLVLFTAMLAKCIFSGFEYITTVMLSAFCPIVYYAIIDNESFIGFIKICFKAGLSLLFAIVAAMGILIMQIASIYGSINNGVQHILLSYLKRSSIDGTLNPEVLIGHTYKEIFMKYLGGNAFGLGFMPDNFRFGFGLLLLVICLFSVLTYFLCRFEKPTFRRSNIALIATTFSALLCPLSWLIIFKQHAAAHPHIDYIIWYMPFLLYGFIVIGKGIAIIIRRFNPRFS